MCQNPCSDGVVMRTWFWAWILVPKLMKWCGPHSESRLWFITEDPGEIKSQQLLLLNVALWKGEDLEVWKRLCFWKFSDWFGWKENYIWLDMQISKHYVPRSFLYFLVSCHWSFDLLFQWSGQTSLESKCQLFIIYKISFFGLLSFIFRKVLHTQLFM